MRPIIAGLALCGALGLLAPLAQAQSQTSPSTIPPAAPGATTGPATAMPPAATAAPPAARMDGAAARPEAGANSFTEGQARSRITDAGYADVTGLRKDDGGIWRGRAMRGGQSVDVALDFRGNVIAGPAASATGTMGATGAAGTTATTGAPAPSASPGMGGGVAPTPRTPPAAMPSPAPMPGPTTTTPR